MTVVNDDKDIMALLCQSIMSWMNTMAVMEMFYVFLTSTLYGNGQP
jgi:hypothetical protein